MDKIISKIFGFFEKFFIDKHATWIDSFGYYKVFIGENILHNKIDSLKISEIYLANYLKEKISFEENSNSNNIISIGSFKIHNTAKLKCYETEKKLITVPTPLVNDSFGTNRCNKKKLPSFECDFPTMTIFDIKLISSFSKDINVLGVGEFIGLYYSIIDYCLSRNLEIPLLTLKYIKSFFYNLCNYYINDYNLFLKYLSGCLLLKCLIMRINKDHQIGCCIDHLFAGYLEKKLKIPHGKAVYYGSILSAAIFLEWEKFGISLQLIIIKGINISIIDKNDIILLCELPKLLEKSILVRPNRLTLLNQIKKKDFKESLKRIIKIVESI